MMRLGSTCRCTGSGVQEGDSAAAQSNGVAPMELGAPAAEIQMADGPQQNGAASAQPADAKAAAAGQLMPSAAAAVEAALEALFSVHSVIDLRSIKWASHLMEAYGTAPASGSWCQHNTLLLLVWAVF